MAIKVGAGGVVSLARAQYAPTLTAHDPNPPLPIDSPPPSTFGGEELHAAPTGRSWAVAFAVLPVFAFGAADELPVGGAPPAIVEESDAFRPVVWPLWTAPRLSHDDPAPTNWGPPAQDGLTLRLDFADVSSLALTGALIDRVTDLSGNGRHFTSSGTNRPTSASDPTIGQAAVFDAASSNRMDATATWADLTSAAAFTIVARCTFASVTSLVSDTYGDGVLFLNGAPGGVCARRDGAGGYRAFGLNDDNGWPPDEAYVAVSLNTEVRLVARHTGGNVEARDGTGTPATVASGDSAPTTQTWQLGNAPGGGAFLDGAISDVLVWDRALDESEIAAVLAWLANKGPARDWRVSEPYTPPRQWPQPWVQAAAPVDDDLPVYVAPSFTPDEDGGPTLTTWEIHTVRRQAGADDDAAFAAPTALADDDDYQPPRAWRLAAPTTGSVDDDAPAGALHGCLVEDHAAPGLAPPFPSLTRWGACTAIDDDVPAGALHGCPVEDHAAPGSAPPFPRLTWWDARTFSDDDVPAGSLFGCLVEESGSVAAPTWVPWLVPTLALAADDLAIAPAVMVEDEHAAPPPVWPLQRLREMRGEQDQEPAGSLHGCLVDDTGPASVAWPARHLARAPDADDGLSTVAALGEDDGSRPAVIWRQARAAAPRADVEDYVAPPAVVFEEDQHPSAPPWPAQRHRAMVDAQEQEPAGSLHGCLPEDARPAATVWRQPWNVAVTADDSVVVTPSLSPVSEDAAAAVVRWHARSVPFVYAADDEAPRVFAGDDDAVVIASRWPVDWLAARPVDDAVAVASALDDDGSRYEPAWPRVWSVAAVADDGCEVVATLADDDQGLLPPRAWPFALWPRPVTDDSLRTTISSVQFMAVIEGRGMVAALEPEPMTVAIESGGATVTIEGGGDTVAIDGRSMVVDLEGRT